MSGVVDSPILVLNQNYIPINACNVRRAVVLVGLGKAELLESSLGLIRTPARTFLTPSIIRLYYLVKRQLPQRYVSRREVFLRHAYTCQYCGDKANKLTLDHVIPRSRRGTKVWENIVSACIPCNRRKPGLTPREAGMRLMRVPRSPRPNPYLRLQKWPVIDEWRKFPPWQQSQ